MQKQQWHKKEAQPFLSVAMVGSLGMLINDYYYYYIGHLQPYE